MITGAIAMRVTNRLRRYGFSHCEVWDVEAVARGEALEDSALESAILQELEALGLHDG